MPPDVAPPAAGHAGGEPPGCHSRSPAGCAGQKLVGATRGYLPTVVDVVRSDSSGRSQGRVIRVDRGTAEVRFGSQVLRVPDRLGRLVVGDWVTVDVQSPESTVVDVLPRTSVVSRATASRTSEQQDLAANVDVVVIVEPASPKPSLGRIERLLVLAWSSGATPLVVLTKADLLEGGRPDAHELAGWARGAAVGVDVLTVSARSGQGLDELRARLGSGRTFVLLGPSGAGKSTLVNRLSDSSALATADIRADGRGRHTTTRRELVEMPDGSALIDTPGLRAVGLVGDVSAVDDAFDDIVGLADRCRFRDCVHVTEPGCAVQDAIADGSLSERRLASWRKLGREADFQARRGDARLEREERARVRARTKAWRRTPSRGVP